jgi:hypothetical protein
MVIPGEIVINLDMLEINTVVFLKTTDEPVFILGFSSTENEAFAEVRRPIQSETGVEHKVETYRVSELQTKKDQIRASMELHKFELEQRDALAKYRQEASRVELPAAETPETYLN